jgi:hypothetical protein
MKEELNMHLRLLPLIAAAAAGLVLVGIGGAHPGNLCTTSCITEYSLQSSGGGPFGVVAGRGGSVWYGHTNTVGRIAADGPETEFAVPTGNANVGVVARGHGDTVWFAERFGNKIGHINAEGNVVEYPIPSAPACGNAGGAHTSLPQGVALARDRAIWFTEECANNIGRLDPRDGSITEFTLPIPNSHPLGLVAGPDGALWFTQRFSAVGRITTDGELMEYPLAAAGVPAADHRRSRSGAVVHGTRDERDRADHRRRRAKRVPRRRRRRAGHRDRPRRCDLVHAVRGKHDLKDELARKRDEHVHGSDARKQLAADRARAAANDLVRRGRREQARSPAAFPRRRRHGRIAQCKRHNAFHEEET